MNEVYGGINSFMEIQICNSVLLLLHYARSVGGNLFAEQKLSL
jgi:hypothetical protein